MYVYGEVLYFVFVWQVHIMTNTRSHMLKCLLEVLVLELMSCAHLSSLARSAVLLVGLDLEVGYFSLHALLDLADSILQGYE